MLKEIIQELKEKGIEVDIKVYGTLLWGQLILITPYNPNKNKAVFLCGHLYIDENIYIHTNKKTGKTYKWCKKCRASRSKRAYHDKNPNSPYVDRIKEVSVVSDFD